MVSLLLIFAYLGAVLAACAVLLGGFFLLLGCVSSFHAGRR